ncbi:MAG: hypothetical protein M0Z41_01225 [Peptococcaceae bacterium]|nr:hypothetical protein [Peptococcaceae bacterium]
MKVVGTRKAPVDVLKQWDAFAEVASKLRKSDVFVPRGMYRFKTFEEVRSSCFFLNKG